MELSNKYIYDTLMSHIKIKKNLKFRKKFLSDATHSRL